MSEDIYDAIPGSLEPVTPLREQRSLIGQHARSWMLIPLLFAVPASIAVFFEGAGDLPFFKTLRAIAPTEVWGAGWVLVAVFALITLRWALSWAYVATNVTMMVSSWAWGASVIYAKFFDDDISVTLFVLALFGFLANASLFAVFMPFHVARPPTNDED